LRHRLTLRPTWRTAPRVFDDVGAGEQRPEFPREVEADDGEHLVQALDDVAAFVDLAR